MAFHVYQRSSLLYVLLCEHTAFILFFFSFFLNFIFNLYIIVLVFDKNVTRVEYLACLLKLAINIYRGEAYIG